MKKLIVAIVVIAGLFFAAGQIYAQDAGLEGFWVNEKIKNEFFFGAGRFAFYATEYGPYARGTYTVTGKDTIFLKADAYYWGDAYKLTWKNKIANEGWYSPEKFAKAIGITMKELDKTTMGLVNGVKMTWKIKKSLLEFKYSYMRYDNLVLKGHVDPHAPSEDAATLENYVQTGP